MILKAFAFLLMSATLSQLHSQAIAQDLPFKELRVGMPKDSALAVFAGKYLLLPMPVPFWPSDTSYLVTNFGNAGEMLGMVRCDSTSVVTIAESVGEPYKNGSTVSCIKHLCDIIYPFTDTNERGNRTAKVEMSLIDLKGSNLVGSRRLTITLDDKTLVNLDVLVPLDTTRTPGRVTLTFVRHKPEPQPVH